MQQTDTVLDPVIGETIDRWRKRTSQQRLRTRSVAQRRLQALFDRMPSFADPVAAEVLADAGLRLHRECIDVQVERRLVRAGLR
ncbi:hypothetical protein LBMAG53_15190 [Planctomycetota bacterium]|nr:hypothetical protein LBMAG53_15190 [Planctomycetota bacterium]